MPGLLVPVSPFAFLPTPVLTGAGVVDWMDAGDENQQATTQESAEEISAF